MRTHAVILGLCLLLVLPAWAQQNRGAGKVTTRTPTGEALNLYDNSWAVVIGVNRYQKWPSLQYAVNDAKAVRDKLVSLGFPEQNITFLTDTQATKDAIERVLGDRLRRQVGEDDRVFIYFAGHGQTEDLPGGKKEGYIVPVDGDKSDLFSTCVSMTSVRQFSERLAAKHVFYAIDACYSGLALVRTGELDPKDRQYLQKVARFPSRQLVTAGSAGEQVIERGGHGAFTNALLIAMDGSADKFPPFGVLTGSELGNYLGPVVSVETNNEQTPQFGRLSAGEGEFMFVLPELGGGPVGDSGNAGQYQAQAGQYDAQIEKLKAQLEEEKRRKAAEDSARAEMDRKRSEAKRLQSELEALRRKREQAPSLPIVPPSAPSAGRDVGEMVHVSDYGFYIDKYEVTNAQYAEFVRATGHRAPECADWGKAGWNTWSGNRPPSGYENHPVVGVSWEDAKAYCEWAGKRLPTEEEWQQTCQGRDGREYPWGSGFDCHRGNFDDETKIDSSVNPGGAGCDGYDTTAPVGSFPSGASPYGAMDMAGNVWEWTATKSGESSRVLRGGSWVNLPHYVRCSYRNDNHPDIRLSIRGFRCAR